MGRTHTHTYTRTRTRSHAHTDDKWQIKRQDKRKKLKRWERGASKLKAKQERDKRHLQLQQSIPNISRFFIASNFKSWGSLNVSGEPAVEDENVDGISDSEEQDCYPADASTSPAHPQQGALPSTETVTVTCSLAAPPISVTSLRARLTAVVRPMIPQMILWVIPRTMLWMMPWMTAGTCQWQHSWDRRPPKLNQKHRSGTTDPALWKTQAPIGQRPFLFKEVLQNFIIAGRPTQPLPGTELLEVKNATLECRLFW